jgi:hypothetical protein
MNAVGLPILLEKSVTCNDLEGTRLFIDDNYPNGEPHIDLVTNVAALSAKLGHLDILKYVLKKKWCTLKAIKYAFDASRDSGDKTIIEYLFNDNKISFKDRFCYEFLITQLTCIVKKGNLDMLRFLVQHGASRIWNKNKLLSDSVCAGHLDLVQYFLDCGANPNLKESFSVHIHTPILLAAHRGHSRILKLLLNRGAVYRERTVYRYCEDSSFMSSCERAVGLYSDVIYILLDYSDASPDFHVLSKKDPFLVYFFTRIFSSKHSLTTLKRMCYTKIMKMPEWFSTLENMSVGAKESFARVNLFFL